MFCLTGNTAGAPRAADRDAKLRIYLDASALISV